MSILFYQTSRLEKLKEFEPQLYDLSKDPGERTNLYHMNPDKVKELSKLLNDIRNADFTR